MDMGDGRQYFSGPRSLPPHSLLVLPGFIRFYWGLKWVGGWDMCLGWDGGCFIGGWDMGFDCIRVILWVGGNILF